MSRSARIIISALRAVKNSGFCMEAGTGTHGSRKWHLQGHMANIPEWMFSIRLLQKRSLWRQRT